MSTAPVIPEIIRLIGFRCPSIGCGDWVVHSQGLPVSFEGCYAQLPYKDLGLEGQLPGDALIQVFIPFHPIIFQVFLGVKSLHFYIEGLECAKPFLITLFELRTFLLLLL